MVRYPVNQSLKHQDPVSTANNFRMHCQREDSTWNVTVHEPEFISPDFFYLAASRESGKDDIGVAQELKVRKIVQNPTDRHFEQIHWIPERRGLVGVENISDA